MQARRLSFLDHAAIFSIKIYRNSLSYSMLHSCRFIPNCSSYSEEAIHRYGALRGTLKALMRILHCHPFSPGGYDPVR